MNKIHKAARYSLGVGPYLYVGIRCQRGSHGSLLEKTHDYRRVTCKKCIDKKGKR